MLCDLSRIIQKASLTMSLCKHQTFSRPFRHSPVFPCTWPWRSQVNLLPLKIQSGHSHSLEKHTLTKAALASHPILQPFENSLASRLPCDLSTKQFSASKQILFSDNYQNRSTSLMNAILHHADNDQGKVAVVDHKGKITYSNFLKQSLHLSREIKQNSSLNNEFKFGRQSRIGLLTENDACYIIGQCATWLAGGISVPLCQEHPVAMWEYFLENSGCSHVLVSKKFSDKISSTSEKLGIPITLLSREKYDKQPHSMSDLDPSESSTNFGRGKNESKEENHRLSFASSDREDELPALIIYTSGTTGRPKGVVLTHGNLWAMVCGMTESWAWSERDVLLHVLPLHHVHGIINCLLTPLACGATCVMEPRFDAKRVWNLLTAPLISGLQRNVSLFMAVPTIYTKLIEYFDVHIRNQNANVASAFTRAAASNKLRLMVSGSAALPTPVSDRWFEITGHRLLERYGMTEIGMALTNPLQGERTPGAVGNPFPNVEVRIVKQSDDNSAYIHEDILAEGTHVGTTVTEGADGQPGHLLVKGPSVFKEYWKNPEGTAMSFTEDGWFKTGDTAVYENGVYRIVGRTSVDIIKSGGYKISALEVERHLLAHPDIIDCVVVGLPDPTWGQKVAAVLTVTDNKSIDVSSLREWAKDYLPLYQIPTVIKCLQAIPRNVMGKVNKKEIVTQIFPECMEDHQS